jgi:hypothetical protein
MSSLHEKITKNSFTALKVTVATIGCAECVCSNCLNGSEFFLYTD